MQTQASTPILFAPARPAARAGRSWIVHAPTGRGILEAQRAALRLAETAGLDRGAAYEAVVAIDELARGAFAFASGPALSARVVSDGAWLGLELAAEGLVLHQPESDAGRLGLLRQLTDECSASRPAPGWLRVVARKWQPPQYLGGRREP